MPSRASSALCIGGKGENNEKKREREEKGETAKKEGAPTQG